MPANGHSLYGLLAPSGLVDIRDPAVCMCGARPYPTAYEEALGDSDVHLFFDHPPGWLGPFRIDGGGDPAPVSAG